MRSTSLAATTPTPRGQPPPGRPTSTPGATTTTRWWRRRCDWWPMAQQRRMHCRMRGHVGLQAPHVNSACLASSPRTALGRRVMAKLTLWAAPAALSTRNQPPAGAEGLQGGGAPVGCSPGGSCAPGCSTIAYAVKSPTANTLGCCAVSCTAATATSARRSPAAPAPSSRAAAARAAHLTHIPRVPASPVPASLPAQHQPRIQSASHDHRHPPPPHCSPAHRPGCAGTRWASLTTAPGGWR